jgi:glycosyltransferase involved in cell wall biosynthesis
VTTVHVVVPAGIDDPGRPSGGNVYDRRICAGLVALGWSVHEHPVEGSWPQPDEVALRSLTSVVSRLPDNSVVLVDGLIASAAAQVLVPAAPRLRLVVLVHMPLENPAEGEMLSAATAVITTSVWTRGRILGLYRLDPDRVHAAPPGVDAAELAPGTAGGGSLVCVAAVTPLKGHDVLLAALDTLPDVPWRCVCVGSLDRDPDFVARLARPAGVELAGALTGSDLDRAYAAADVLVLASRSETYGMVVTEALARGLPVIAGDVGGLPEALGRTRGGEIPGLLVPPDDPDALAAAIRLWLVDADLRKRLRQFADERRTDLTDWSVTAARVAGILSGAGRLPGSHPPKSP